MRPECSIMAFYGPGCPVCDYWVNKVAKSRVIRGRFGLAKIDVSVDQMPAELHRVPALPWFVVSMANKGRIFFGNGPDLLAWAEQFTWEEKCAL